MNQRTRSRSRLSYANVTATLALFVALGGSAYAATALPADSVGSAQIKPSAVRSPEIADGAVRGSEVADGSLRPADFAGSEEPITKVIRRPGPVVAIAPAHSADASAYCRSGERALGGGGFDAEGFHDNFVLFSSIPRTADEPRIGKGSSAPDGWEVRYFNRSEGNGDDARIVVGAYVVCGS
jgi:hypothetical protein